MGVTLLVQNVVAGLVISFMLCVPIKMASAQSRRDDPERIAPGRTIRLPADVGTDSEILGMGFDWQLRERDSSGAQHRVHEARYKTTAENRFEVEVDIIENQAELGGYAKLLFLSAGARRMEKKRYAVLRVSRTKKIETLREKLPKLDDAAFVAARVHYGWAVYHIIEGTDETFSRDVAVSLKRLGAGAGQVIRDHQLHVRKIYLGMTPVEEADPQDIISDESVLEQRFHVSGKNPVPIAVEYRALAAVPLQPVSWASSSLRPGQYRLKNVSVRVSNTKSSGHSWDGMGGIAPDPFVQVLVDGEYVHSCFKQDRFEVDCSGDRIITLTESSSLEVRVTDRDLMANDPIGRATIPDLMDKGVAYDDIELTPNNSQLERVTVRLVPVSVEHSNQKDTSEETPAQRTAPPADPEPRPTADQLLARRLLPASPQIPVESSVRPLAPASRLPAPSEEFALPSGVRIKRTAEGAGPQARYGQQVLVHYVVRSVADGLVLDDTVARRAPQALRIGVPGLFPGLVEGVRGMTAGEQRHLYVPASMAYPITRPGNAEPAPEPLEVDVRVIRILSPRPSEE